MAQDRECFVYVFACYPGPPDSATLDPGTPLWRKVGITFKPVSRLTECQTGNPFPVRLEYCLKCESSAVARLVEGVCHAVLGRRYEQRREWFHASNTDIKSVIRKAGEQAGADIGKEFCWYKWQDTHHSDIKAYSRDVRFARAVELDPIGTQAFELATKH